MDVIRNLFLVLAGISFVVVIGGAVYEHLALVPVWTAAVPESLAVFQGPYRLMPERFWIPIHPVTLGLMVIALILNWRSARRWSVIVVLGGYAAVLAVTFVYFVPELIALTQQTPYSQTVDAALTARGQRWETLSLVRLAFLVILAIILLGSLTRPPGVTRDRDIRF